MRAVIRNSVSVLAMSLVFAATPSCSAFKPMTRAEVNDFEYGGYPDSQDRRDCVREASRVLKATGPTGDMYDESRKRLRLEVIDRCMKKRGH